MVDHYGLPVAGFRIREYHYAVRRRFDRRAGTSGDVEPLVHLVTTPEGRAADAEAGGEVPDRGPFGGQRGQEGLDFPGWENSRVFATVTCPASRP